MMTGNEIEYTNLKMSFFKEELVCFLKGKLEPGNHVEIVESNGYMIIFIKRNREIIRLNFKKMQNRVIIMDNYFVKEKENNELMESIIKYSGGNAVKKVFKPQYIEIQKIVFGETVLVSRISGQRKEVIYQRPYFSEEQFKQSLETSRVEQEIETARLEINYELACLNEAMKQGDEVLINKYLQKLEELHKKMFCLEAW